MTAPAANLERDICRSYRMKAYALTDVGVSRSVNQDYVFCSTEPVGNLPNLFIVADGMGGHKAGDIASKFSVETFAEQVKTSEEDNPITVISEAIKYTNARLIELAATSEDYFGMGTTFVVATIIGGSLYVANVGDSRLYIHGKTLSQVTRDHSVVEELVTKGIINRKEARTHDKKNEITRAMGGGADVMADFFEVEILEGDSIIMCSDGLCNMVEDKDIAKVLSGRSNIKDKAARLINMANDNGGKDNISLIIIEP